MNHAIDPLLTGPKYYKDMKIQPVEFAMANMTDDEFSAAMRFNIQKYNWRRKDDLLSDIDKIIQYAQLWKSKLKAKAT